jgi:Zn-dependent protease with chaperone function
MDSNDLQIHEQLNVLALAALNAIPVATFALWLDYFERRVAEERVSRDYELAPDIQLLNSAGITTALALAVVFFATRPYRTEHPVASILLFIGAIVVQSWLQAKVARRISPVGIGNQDAGPLGREFNSSLWLAGMVTGYLTLTGVLALSMATLFHTLGATKALVALAGGLGALGGVMVGLTLVYALAPLTIRKVFPVREMPPSALKVMIEKAFDQASMPSPDIYIIQGDDLSTHNLMIAGFPWARGVFKPAVFVFEALTRAEQNEKEPFRTEELHAMILHEVSHASLNHLKKRLLLTCMLLPIGVLTGGAGWVAAATYLPSGTAELVQFMITVAVIATPFQAVNRLIRKQEIEADLNAVIQYGAEAKHMISALERLDRLNGRRSEVAHGAHPSTQERINELRSLLPPMPLHASLPEDSPTDSKDDQNNRAA